MESELDMSNGKSQYIIGGDGVTKITPENVAGLLRRYVNERAGKATRGRIADSVMAEWATAGFPICADTYGAAKIISGIDASKEDRAMARMWAIDTGRISADKRGRTADTIVTAWRDAGSPFYDTREVIGTVVGRKVRKDGKYGKEVRFTGYRDDMGKDGAMVYRIVAACLADVSDADRAALHIDRVESATGRVWDATVEAGEVIFVQRTAITELFITFGTDADTDK